MAKYSQRFVQLNGAFETLSSEKREGVERVDCIGVYKFDAVEGWSNIIDLHPTVDEEEAATLVHLLNNPSS